MPELPKPFYEEPGITIYHADCREILPLLPAGSVDLVLTDPPFGISWGRATWTDSIEVYPELMRWFVSECNRLVANGWCFVFQGMPNVARFHEWFPDAWRIYAACKNFAQIRPTGIWHSWDPVVFWSNGTVTRNLGNRGQNVNRDYFVGNVAGRFRETSKHPCPKPIDTIRHIVSISSQPGGVILDPFLGSGTTLVAAKQLGRRAIGIEIEESYCAIAVNRLSQAILPLQPPEPLPLQLPL